jgi:hypothetical protein
MRQLGVERRPRLDIRELRCEGMGITVDLVSVAYRDPPRPIAGGGVYYLQNCPSWAAGLPNFSRTRFRIERQGVILGVGGQC